MSDKGGDSSDSASSQTPAQWAAAQSNTSIAAWKENDILSFSVAQLRALTTAQVSQITVPWAIPGAAWTADTLNAVPVQYWGAFGPRYLSTTINGRVTVQTLSQYNGVSSGVASGISNWFGDLGYSYQSSTGSWVFSPSVIAGISNDRIAAIGSGLGTASHAPTLGANNTPVSAQAFESALNAATSSGEHMTTWNISVSSSDQSAGVSKRSVVMFGAGWADMGAVFMSALTSSQLGAIAHPEAVLTAAQFGAFSANQLIALRQMDWSKVTAAQLNAISLEAFSGLQTNIIAAISASAWGGLDQAHTQKLNATDISLLSASSIAALKYLGYALTASVAGVLTASQVAGISDSCWAQLSDTNFLNALPLSVMQSIAPSAFARMSSAVIASMDSLHLGALTNAQSLVFPVNELSNASALFYRNPNTLNFNDFVNNPSVNWGQAPASFIRLLTLAQLKLLQPSQIGRLSLAAIAGFTRSQTQALTLAQIQAWRPAQLSAALYMSRRVDVVADIFTVSTVTQISPAFWGRVDSNFLNALSLDAFRALTTAQIEAISTDAFAGIDQAHFEAFTITQLLALTAGQVGSFRGEYLSIFFLRNIRLVSFKGLVPEQMHRLHDYLFNTVATNAFATADPVLLATAEQQFATLLASILESDDGREAWLQQSVNLLIRLNWLDPAAASTLSASDVQSVYSALNWAWMSGTFLNSIMVSVFAQIRASSISQLNLSALAALDSAHIQAITVTQAAGLSGEQLSAISNLGALQANVVQSLTATQLVGITTDWSTISPTFLNHMLPWQFAALTPAQFGQLTAAQLTDPNNTIAWLLLSAADWNALPVDTFAQLCTGDSPPILQASSAALLGLSGEQMATLAQASRFYNGAQRQQLLHGLFGSFTSDQAQNLLSLVSLDDMDQVVLQVGLVNLMAKIDGTTFGTDNAIAALAMLRQTQASFVHAENLSLVLASLSSTVTQQIQNRSISNVLFGNSLISRGTAIASLLNYKNSLGTVLTNQVTNIYNTIQTNLRTGVVGDTTVNFLLTGPNNRTAAATRVISGLFDAIVEAQFPNASDQVRQQIEQIKGQVISRVSEETSRSTNNTAQPPLFDLSRKSPVEVIEFLKSKTIQGIDDWYQEKLAPSLQANAKLAAVGSAATTSLALVSLLVSIGASINAFGAAAYAAVDDRLTAKERQNLVASSVLGGLAYAAQGLQLPVTLIMQAIVQKATGQKYVNSSSYLDAVWQKFTEGFTALRNSGAIHIIQSRSASAQSLTDGPTRQFFVADPTSAKPVFLSYQETANGGFAHVLLSNKLGLKTAAIATFKPDGTLDTVIELGGKTIQPTAETAAILPKIAQAAQANGKNVSRMLISLDDGSAGLADESLNTRLDVIANSTETPLARNVKLVTDNVQRFIYRAVRTDGPIDPTLDTTAMINAARELLTSRGVAISDFVANDVSTIVLQIQAGKEPGFQVKTSLLNVQKTPGDPNVEIGPINIFTSNERLYPAFRALGYKGTAEQLQSDLSSINTTYILKALTDKYEQGGYDQLFQRYSDQVEVGKANDWSIFSNALKEDLAAMGVRNVATADPAFATLLGNLQASALTGLEDNSSLYSDARVLGVENNSIVLQDLARTVSARFDRQVASGRAASEASEAYRYVTAYYDTAPVSKLEDRAVSRTLVRELFANLPSSESEYANPLSLMHELFTALESTHTLNDTIKQTLTQAGVSRVSAGGGGETLDRVLVFDKDILLPALLEQLQRANPERYPADLTIDSPEFIGQTEAAYGNTTIRSVLEEHFQGGNDSLALFEIPYRSIYAVPPEGSPGRPGYVPGVLKPEIAQGVQLVLKSQLTHVVNQAAALSTTRQNAMGDRVPIVGRAVYSAVDTAIETGNVSNLATLWNSLETSMLNNINRDISEWGKGFEDILELDLSTKAFAESTDPVNGLNVPAAAEAAIEPFRAAYVNYALDKIAAANLSESDMLVHAGKIIRALGSDSSHYGEAITQTLAPKAAPAPIVQRASFQELSRPVTPTLEEAPPRVPGAPQRAVIIDDNSLATYIVNDIQVEVGRRLQEAATGRPLGGFPETEGAQFGSAADISAKLNYLVDLTTDVLTDHQLVRGIVESRASRANLSGEARDFAYAQAMLEVKAQLVPMLDHIINNTPYEQGVNGGFKLAYRRLGGAEKLLQPEVFTAFTEKIQGAITAARQDLALNNTTGAQADTLANALGDSRVQGVLERTISATSPAADAPVTAIKATLEVATPQELGFKLVRRFTNVVNQELPGSDPIEGLRLLLERGYLGAKSEKAVQEWGQQFNVALDHSTVNGLNRDVIVTVDTIKQVLLTTYDPTSPIHAQIENAVIPQELVDLVLRAPVRAGVLPAPVTEVAVVASPLTNRAFLQTIVEYVNRTSAPQSVSDFLTTLSGLLKPANGQTDPNFTAELTTFARRAGFASGVTGERPNFQITLTKDQIEAAITESLIETTGGRLNRVAAARAFVQSGAKEALNNITGAVNSPQLFALASVPARVGVATPNLNAVVRATSNVTSYSSSDVIDVDLSAKLAKVFTDYAVESLSLKQRAVGGASDEAVVGELLRGLANDFSAHYSSDSLLPPKLTASIKQFMTLNNIGIDVNGKLNVGLKVNGDMLLVAVAQSIQEKVTTRGDQPIFQNINSDADVSQLIVKIKANPSLTSEFKLVDADGNYIASHLNSMVVEKAWNDLPDASLAKQQALAEIFFKYQIEPNIYHNSSINTVGGAPLRTGELRRQLLFDVQDLLSKQPLPEDLVVQLKTFAEEYGISVLTDTEGGQRLNSNLTLDFDVLGNALIKVLQDHGQLTVDEISGIRAQELIPQLFELKVFDTGTNPKTVSLQTKLTYPENQRVLDSFSAIGQAAPDLIRTNVPLPKATIVTETIARQTVTSPARADELSTTFVNSVAKTIRTAWQQANPRKTITPEILTAEYARVMAAEHEEELIYGNEDPVRQAFKEALPELLDNFQNELRWNDGVISTADGTPLKPSPEIIAAQINQVIAEDGLYERLGGVGRRGAVSPTEPAADTGGGMYASLNTVLTVRDATGGGAVESIANNTGRVLQNAAQTADIPIVAENEIAVPVEPAALDAGTRVANQTLDLAQAQTVAGRVGVQGNVLEIAPPEEPLVGEETAAPNLGNEEPLTVARVETVKQKFTRLGLAGQGFAQLGFALFASIVGIAAGIAGIVYAAQSKALSSSAKTLTITMNVVRIFSSVTILVGSAAQIASSVIKAVSIAEDVASIANVAFGIGNVVGIATSAAQLVMQINGISTSHSTGRAQIIEGLAILDTTIQFLLAIAGTFALIGGPVGIAIAVIVLLVSSLIPSSAAIATAITYHESYTNLKGQGLYNEAQVMFTYYQTAALDSTPIVNWTSSIYTAEMKKAQEKLMDYAWMDQSAEQRLFYSITSNSAFKDNFDGVRDQTYAAAAALTQPLVNLSQGLTRAVTLMLSQDNLSYFDGDKVATVKLAATSNYATNTLVRAPKLINATVSGTTVTLTFNQNLASLNSQLPDLSTFAVQVNGVAATLNGFSLSGNTVTLVLNTAVTAGQVVTFSYSDPTAGDDQHAVQSLGGKDFASVSNHAVINLLDTDTRAPKLVDAVVQDRYLTLVFDEVLNSATDRAPTAGEFTVSLTDANGTVTTPQILGINVSDYRVLLTLVNSVASGDVLSVSYTPASSGSKLLQDTASNQVAAFTSGSAGVVSVENTTAVSTMTASRAGWLQYDNFVASIQGTGTEAASVLNGSDYTVYASESAASSGTARLRYLSLSNVAGEFDLYAASRAVTTNDTIWLDASSALGTVSFSVNVNDMTVWGGQGYNSYSLLRSYANSSNRIIAANSWSTNNNIVSIAGSSSDSNMTVNLDHLLTADNISTGLPSGQSVFKVLGANDGLDVVVGTGDNQSYFATTNVANINLTGANANVLVGERSQVKVGVNGRVQVDMDMWRSLNLPAPTIPSSGTTGVVTGGYGSYSLLNFSATDSINTSFEGKLNMTYQIGHLPALGAWAVNVDGTLVDVSSMSVRGNTVTLNLASVVQQNQAVSVGYNDLSAVNDLETLQDLAGNDVASFYPQSVVNVTADTTAPTLVVATVQGSSLILHFSETLNQTYKPLSTAFTVLVNNVPALVSKVAFNDSTSLRLTLNSAVPAGQTVSVGYTLPSDNTISAQDLAGNTLNSFIAANAVNLANITRAPSLRSLTANGNVVTLNFDGTVRYTLSDASAFLVTVNNTPATVSSVSVAGNSVLLYLSSAVSSDQIVEVSYTPPQQVNDATTLRDWLGNVVSVWGAQMATNITGQDLTPPTLQYAIANGNSVVLTFSETLDGRTNFTALTNAFVVQANKQAVLVTQVAVSGANVTLSLASAINYGDVVTLAYTDFSTANDRAVVQDLSGNDAASFSGVNVVNNSPDTTPPTLVNATVTDNQLVLVFSENLNNVSGYLPPISSMNVSVAGGVVFIVAGSLVGNTATLTLNNAVNAGDYVTFSYIDPSSDNDTGAFQDLAGNDLLSIANFGVTNLTGVDSIAPSLKSAQVSGNVLTLTFSEALVSTANFTPSASAFRVYVNGNLDTVSAVTLNGTQASLTLVTPVDHTQTVTVSYVQPSSQQIQDGSGNLLASFLAQSVSNVTSDNIAPSLTSMTVAGALLTLTFSEKLANDPSLMPNVSEFSVKVDGHVVDILSTVAQNNTLTITLSQAVTAEKKVSVDYTPSATGTNNLQDTANNKTAKFSQTALNLSGIPSIQNANINGSYLTMTFNQLLDGTSGHVPPLSAFTVKVNGVITAVSQLAVQGYTATLTLGQVVTAGQVVTVSYTDPSSANDVTALQNLAGMDVQTFSAPYAVHNLTPALVDYTPPSLSTAVVNGSVLTLTFSEALDAGVGEWLVNYLPNNQYDASGKPLVTSSLLATGFVNVLGSNGNDTIVINDQSGLATNKQLNYVQLGNGQGVQVNNYDTSGNLLLALGSAGQANVILESGSSLQKLFTNKLVQSPADVANFKANRDTVTLRSLSSLTAFLSGYETVDATDSTSSLTAEIGSGDHQIKLGGQTVNLQFDKAASNTVITTKQIQNSWLDYQYFNFNGINADGLWVGRESDGTVLLQAQWTNDSGAKDVLSVSYDGTLSNVVLEVGNVLATADSSQLRLDKLIEVMSSPAFSSDPKAASHAMTMTDSSNGAIQAKLYRITDIVAYSSAPQATLSGGV